MKIHLLYRNLLLVFPFLSGCSLGPLSSQTVQVQLILPEMHSSSSGPHSFLNPPTTVDGFDCFAVNVYGPGINNQLTGFHSDSNCAYPGVTSNLIASSKSVTLQVPAGPKRVIQVIGIATGTGCPSKTPLVDFMNRNGSWSTSPSIIVNEIGSTEVDLFTDTQVTIKNTYKVSGSTTVASFPFNCDPIPKPSPTPAGTALSLVAAYSGSDNTNTSGSPQGSPPSYLDTISSSGAPSSMASVGSADLLRLGGAISSTLGSPVVVQAPTLSDFARLDLWFDASPITFTGTEHIRVTGLASGGTSTTCNNTLDTTQAGSLELRIFHPGYSPLWSNQGYQSIAPADIVNTTAENVNFTTQAEVTASTFVYQQATATTYPAGKFIILSLRSSALVGSNSTDCSMLAVRGIKLFIE